LMIVENLRVRRGSFVLYVPRLEVGRGECLVVLGPSGAGKTTLLKSLAGLLRVESGRILIDGMDVSRLPPEQRGFAYVPQSYALFPHMKVWDNIAYGLRARGMDRARIEEKVRSVAKVLGIEDLLDRYPHQLSAGQRQRVAIARAIVVEPRVLLLDEPLANIDPSMRSRARNFLRSLLTKLDVAVVYATHSLVDAVSMGDRIAYVVDGKLAFLGNVEQFLSTDYAKPYLEEIEIVAKYLRTRT